MAGFMVKKIFFLFVLFFTVLNAEENITKFLKKDIKRINPFDQYRGYESFLGVPLPSAKTPKIPYKSPFNSPFERHQNRAKTTTPSFDFNTYGISTSVLNMGLNKLSSLIGSKSGDIVGKYISGIKFDVNLSSSIDEKQKNLGGDIKISAPLYKKKLSELYLLGTVKKSLKEDEWSGSYGFSHKLKAPKIQNLYFMQSFTQDQDKIGEKTFNYGVEYSPIKNFSTFIQKEIKTIGDTDTTKAGVQYRINF